MNLTNIVFLGAAITWIALPMNVNHTSVMWKKPEYVMAFAMFGFSGIAMFLGITSSVGGDALLLIRFSPLIAAGIFVTIVNLANGAIVRPPGLLLFGVFVPMGAFAIVEHSFVMPLMSLAILGPAIVVPRLGYSTEPLYTGLRDAVRVTLIVLSLYIMILPGQVIGPCRGDKCSIWGLSIGAFGSGNAFGVYLAFVAGISIILARNAITAALSTIASAALVDATSGRSAMIAWAVTVLAAHTWRLTRSSKKSHAVKVTGIGAAALVTVVGTYPWRPDDFTGRANLWIVAKEQFLSSPLFGYGPSFWVRQERTSYVDSNYATHNLLWELLISSGFVGTALLTMSVLWLIRSSHPEVQGLTVVLTTAWLASSTLEVTAAPGRLYLLPGVLLLIFVQGQSRTHKTGGSSDFHESGALISRADAESWSMLGGWAPTRPGSGAFKGGELLTRKLGDGSRGCGVFRVFR
ncbi:O-antigen ligase family protein [Pseudarthrobacter albicanus]|uniref:O-antigen ligase family protein n=1 Tax=Pseudarthrobacter albicanus TaxID=2823873 RepID=UPI001BAE09F1|nr:O-antigen ligase family protein [Pseudarthrobacter albicanus]